MKEIWLAALPATIPTLAVLVGILLNQNGLKELGARIDRIEADLREFYRSIGKLEGKVESLENRK